MVTILELNWSDLSGATVGWFISFSEYRDKLFVCPVP